MKQGLNIFPRLFLLGLIAALSACSSVKDLTNVDLTNMKIWPFGNSADAPRVYLPANSTHYMCEGNKKFFVRMLEKGASVWLILPEREVLLTQSGSSKVYTNGISKLDLSNSDATLDVNETTHYVACKANGVAKVTKVESVEQVTAPVESVKTEAAKLSEGVAKVAAASKPEMAVKPETKQATEKGWFDKLKFWERDEQAQLPKSIIVESPKVDEPKTVVEAPVKQDLSPVLVEEAPAPTVVGAKAVEPTPMKLATPVEEAATVDLQAMIREVAQQGSQEEQALAPAEDKVSSYQALVAKTLEAWANAWRTKNADEYLSFYSAKFKPEGIDQKAWIAQRKQRVGAKTAEITLVLDQVKVTADAKKAEATFIQRYTSGKFSDTVAKVLSFESENGHWFIIKETSQSKK